MRNRRRRRRERRRLKRGGGGGGVDCRGCAGRDLEVYHSFLLHLVGHIHQLLVKIKHFIKYFV